MSRWQTVADAELDQRLASELRTLAQGARLPDDWSRMELLPVVRSRIDVDQRPAAPSRAAALVGIVGAVALVALVAAVVLTRLPGSWPGGPYGEASHGDFTLTISAAKPDYAAGEAIDVVGSFLYSGSEESIHISTFHPITGFGVRQTDGPLEMEAGWPAVCRQFEMTRDEQLMRPFTKTGGWNRDDPNADFYEQWWQEPELRLPAGRWQITVYSDFHLSSDCTGERVTMEASIRLTVGGADNVQPSPIAFIEVGPDGLRTFAVDYGINGIPVSCPAFAVIDPVVGRLEGSADDPLEPIWLVGPDGDRLSVVWPRGYSVTFEPRAILRDADGRVMARAGDTVELGQIRVGDSAGTYEDPYIASGLIFDGCYPPDYRLLPSPAPTERPTPTATVHLTPGPTAAPSPTSADSSPTAPAIAAGSWRKLPPAPIEDGFYATGVWTGTEFIVWGTTGLPEGAAYDLATDSWRVLPGGPDGPRLHLDAVWTGELVIAWHGGAGNRLPEGGIYDPAVDAWRPITPGRLAGADGQLAWTGAEMLVLTSDMRAAAYDPATDAWRDLPSAPLPPGSSIAEWTGTEWLVIAMEGDLRAPAPAAAFNPASGVWQPLSPTPLTSLDEGVEGVWIGDRLIIGRGHEGTVTYHPATDNWEPFEAPGCPMGIGTISAVWTGELVLTPRFLSDLSTGQCFQLPPAPKRDGWDSNRHDGAAVVWTGSELLVWGGGTGGDIDIAPADGAAFMPD